jgi:hypothetical protein
MDNLRTAFVVIAGSFIGLLLIFGAGIFVQTFIPPSEPKITIATDPPTGCEYLIYGTTMTPRLLPNGDQVCTQPTETKK